MKRTIAFVLGALTFAGVNSLVAQTPTSAADKQIIEIERAIHTAFAKGDGAGFRQHVLPEAFGIDAASGVVKVADWVGIMKEYKAEKWDIDNIQVHRIGADSAVITYRWSIGWSMKLQAVLPYVMTAASTARPWAR